MVRIALLNTREREETGFGDSTTSADSSLCDVAAKIEGVNRLLNYTCGVVHRKLTWTRPSVNRLLNYTCGVVQRKLTWTRPS